MTGSTLQLAPDWRPSKRIERVLRGLVPLESEEPGIQSACSKHIYDGAVEILAMKDIEKRRKALKRIPDMIRPHVEAEVMRLFNARRRR